MTILKIQSVREENARKIEREENKTKERKERKENWQTWEKKKRAKGEMKESKINKRFNSIQIPPTRFYRIYIKHNNQQKQGAKISHTHT